MVYHTTLDSKADDDPCQAFDIQGSSLPTNLPWPFRLHALDGIREKQTAPDANLHLASEPCGSLYVQHEDTPKDVQNGLRSTCLGVFLSKAPKAHPLA